MTMMISAKIKVTLLLNAAVQGTAQESNATSVQLEPCSRYHHVCS